MLRFADSFDHYVTADMLLKWSAQQNNPSISAGNGRNSTAALRIANLQQTLTKILDNQATLIVGFGFRAASLPTGSAYQLLTLFDSATLHVNIKLGTDGKLSADRNGTVLGTGTAILSAGVYYYIEAKITISDTVGVVTVKLNGATELNLTAQDTRNGGNATADRIRIGGGPDENRNYDYDDFYICDTSGSVNNDFLGDVRVEAIFPSGDGNSSVLVGSDGNSVNNSLLVDEAAPNGDTDYVGSATPGDKDTYAFGNVTPTSGTVAGVQVLPYARKDDAGARSIVTVARVSATEVDGPVQTLSTTYNYLPDIRETKPGGGAWTISDVNAAEFGVKINA